MLIRIFTIVALLVFIILMFLGSTIEPAMLKSATVFIVLVVGTRVSVFFLDIIKENTPGDQESSPSHH